MIAVAELEKSYRPVHGDPNVLGENAFVAILHGHVGDGDSTSPARGIIRATIEDGFVDLMAITNHDTDGYDNAARIRDDLSSRNGNNLELVRASEITTARNQHVLVYGFDRIPAPGQPIERLIEESERQGAFVSLAHPELGDFSVTEPQIEDLLDKGLRFALEVHNEGADQVDRAHAYSLPRLIRRRLPESGSNAKAKKIFERLRGRLVGATGGPDGHNKRHRRGVITTGPEDMNIFEAIGTGKGVIWEQIRLPRITLTNVAVGHVRGKRLERRRQRGELDSLSPEPLGVH